MHPSLISNFADEVKLNTQKNPVSRELLQISRALLRFGLLKYVYIGLLSDWGHMKPISIRSDDVPYQHWGLGEKLEVFPEVPEKRVGGMSLYKISLC